MLLILVYLWSDSGGVLDSGAKFKQIQGLQVCFSQALPTGTRSSPDILVGILSCESLLCFSFALISLFHFSPPSLPSRRHSRRRGDFSPLFPPHSPWDLLRWHQAARPILHLTAFLYAARTLPQEHILPSPPTMSLCP